MLIGEGKGISLDLGHTFWDRLAFNGGIAILSADDTSGGFTREVCPRFTGGFCDNPKKKSSSINIYSFSVETGLQHRETLMSLHPKMFFLIGGFIGYRGFLVRREITNCSNCGGNGKYYSAVYIAPLLGIGFTSKNDMDFYLYARHENFTSGDDMDPALWIGLAMSKHF